ncbi:MAG: Fic family protein [Candidatus Berkelbacteria bacterium]
MNITSRQQQIIIAFITGTNSLSSLLVLPAFADANERTLQRDISELVDKHLVKRHGEARAITYTVGSEARFNLSLPKEGLEVYFADENRANVNYDFNRLDALESTSLFSDLEQKELASYNKTFYEKLKTAPRDIIRRERERITIELSWKSSQIEGNTYTLLETESLIKDGIPAAGKSKDETLMVLNHKKALDFSEENRELFSSELTIQTVIDLHKILADGIIDFGLRERSVGITGSTYRPLDNKFQVEEELKKLCNVINSKQDVFSKALLAFTYLCYIQPFNDGNKRTARILANAILYANDSFPLSLRAVDVNTYKLAILAFYELGTLGNAKKVFIDQAKFAAENYAI